MDKKNINGINLEHRLTNLEVGYYNIEKKVDGISSQVYNHLPSSLKKIKEEIYLNQKDLKEKLDEYEDKNKNRFIATLISILILLLSVIFGLLTKF